MVFRNVKSTSNLTFFGSIDEFYRKYSILKLKGFVIMYVLPSNRNS